MKNQFVVLICMIFIICIAQTPESLPESVATQTRAEIMPNTLIPSPDSNADTLESRLRPEEPMETCLEVGDGTNDVIITNPNGNVGIGTASPGAKLDVAGSVEIGHGNFTQFLSHGHNARLLLPAASNGAGSGDVNLYWWASEPGMTWTGAGIARNMVNTSGWPRVNTGLSGQMMRFDEGTGILFYTETSTGARYTPMYLSGNDMIANGNVGIGTASPSAALHLYQDRYTLYGPNSSWGAYLQVGGNGRVTTYASVAATNGNLHLDAANGGYATYINYYSANNTYLNAAGGNVGIGTTGPGGRLQVNNTDGSYFVYGSTGNITAYDAEATTGELRFGSAWDRKGIYSDNAMNILAVSGLALSGRGNNTDLYINTSGSVGIGTTSPEAKLHVAGGMYSTDGLNHPIKSAGELQNNTTFRSGIYQNNGDGLYNSTGSATVLHGWWHVINMHHQHNNGYNAQIAVPLSPGGGENYMFFRKASGGVWSAWRKLTDTPWSDGEVTNTYYIYAGNLYNVPNNCGSTNSYYNCSGTIGFWWNSTGSGSVTSVTIDFSVGVECHSGVWHTTQMNSSGGPSFYQTTNWCNCDNQSGTINLTGATAGYIVGGTNYFYITGLSTCLGFIPHAAWGSGVYAKVTVTYTGGARLRPEEETETEFHPISETSRLESETRLLSERTMAIARAIDLDLNMIADDEIAITVSDFGSDSACTMEKWVSFSDEFVSKLNGATPVITVTPISESATISVIEKTNTGFKIKCASETDSYSFDWIAIARVKPLFRKQTKSPLDFIDLKAPIND